MTTQTWQPIDTAPRDGTLFYARIDELPYVAKYDNYGRFVWCNHSNIGEGASYLVREIDGKHMLEKTKDEEYNYQKQWSLWKRGFEHKPTHWMPLPPPPEKE